MVAQHVNCAKLRYTAIIIDSWGVALTKGGDTKGNFVAQNSCKQQTTQCVVEIHVNFCCEQLVATNKMASYLMQQVAHNIKGRCHLLGYQLWWQ